MTKNAKKLTGFKKAPVKGVVRKETAGKRSARKQKDGVSRPTKRAPNASRKAEGRKPKKEVDVLSNSSVTSATTNERRALISIGGTEATSASVPVGQIDVHQLFGVLDDAGVIERVSERIAGTVLDRLQEKFEQFRQRSASHTRYTQGSEDTFDESEETAQGAPGDISAECSTIQPASAQGDDDDFADSIAPEPFNEFDDEIASQPPQKLSTKGCSSESRQAPIPEPVNEFDEFDEIASQPSQKLSTNVRSSESKQLTAQEIVKSFNEEFGHEVDDDF